MVNSSWSLSHIPSHASVATESSFVPIYDTHADSMVVSDGNGGLHHWAPQRSVLWVCVFARWASACVLSVRLVECGVEVAGGVLAWQLSLDS